jgi:hypothetical protein
MTPSATGPWRRLGVGSGWTAANGIDLRQGRQQLRLGLPLFFSVLAGICRGPVDEIYLIKSDGKVFWDGTYIRPGQFLPGQANATDPVRPPDTDVVASAQAIPAGR